ncbi:MAG: RDD family protein [Actinomycetota bacterium]
MAWGPDRTVTPEAVPLSFDAAGLGSRMIATIIDTAIQGGALLLFTFAYGAATEGGAGTSAAIAFLIVVFLLLWGYYPILEGLWHGRTIGKRAQGLRVVDRDGRPVRWPAVIVRNLLRIVDLLPGFYAVGMISMALTHPPRRLGDLAAGTFVVRETKARLPAPVIAGDTPALPWIDATALTDRDYTVIRSFLERRTTLRPEARTALAAQLATAFRHRVPGSEGMSDEAFLEAAASAYRARAERPF